MCGRYAFSHGVEDYQALFEVANPEEFPADRRYNVAPTQTVAVVFRSREGVRKVGQARWGLIPHWVKDPREWKASTFNARSEDAAGKPAFRQACKRGRVLIPASGFYEWKLEGGKKVPYFVRSADGAPLAFAGLMDVWRNREEEEGLLSCAIMTAPAVGELRELHQRMPLIVPRSEFDDWLSPEGPEEALARVLRHDPRQVEVYRVSSEVNSARDDRPEFILPAG